MIPIAQETLYTMASRCGANSVDAKSPWPLGDQQGVGPDSPQKQAEETRRLIAAIPSAYSAHSVVSPVAAPYADGLRFRPQSHRPFANIVGVLRLLLDRVWPNVPEWAEHYPL